MLVSIIIVCLAACGSLGIEPKEQAYRLPGNIEPVHYDINLDLSKTFSNNKFEYVGSVVIKAIPKQSLKSIRMHAANMTFSSLQVNGIDVERNETNDEFQFLDLNLKKELSANTSFTISINYIALLHEDMYGFYVSSYEDKDSKTHYIATTQFESVYARRAFPCFDEPQYKATFQVTIKRPPGNYTSVSNTPKTNHPDPDTDTDTDIFEKTPRMSTYLVAFVVSELVPTQGTDHRLQVWARLEAKNQTKYTASIGMKVVEALNKFTGIPYFETMIDKLDMMALPDFAAGAMENWGILTYRETALLYDDEVSSNRDQQRVASVVAHEMAHQWFGDYVTTKWWDTTWLNEGFATFFEYYITDDVESTWEMKEQMLMEEVHPVLESDSLKNTKRLNEPVFTPTEIQAHFGSISYNKGGSIIRMMDHFLGHDVFKKSLNRYLNQYKFGSVVPSNLFTALEEEAQVNKVFLDSGIQHIMSTWTNQPGYPVVIVKAEDDLVTFSQERFLLTDNLTKQDELFWHIPISYRLSTQNNYTDTKPQFWLTPNEPEKVKQMKDLDWLIVNIQQTGYYRVQYDEKLYKKIGEALKSEKRTEIHKLNRAQIIDDSMNLARAGKLDYKVALEVIDFLSEETDYFPWYAAFRNFRYLLQRYPEDERTGSELRDYLIRLMENLLKDKDFEDVEKESHIDVFTRAMALNWACELAQKECVNKAKKMFTKAAQDKVPKNVRDTVYCVGIREGTSADWNMLWNKYKEANVAAEKVRILNSLGCKNDSTILNKYLAKSISHDIRQQDASYAFSAVYTGSSLGVELALNFLIDNHIKISDRYGGMNALGNAITGLAARLNKNEQIKKLSDFLKKNADQLKDVKIVADAAIENAQANLKWAENYNSDIEDYLKSHGSPTIILQPALLCITILLVYFNIDFN